MSDIDEKKPTGKAGKKKKHADQRNRKSDQRPQPKTAQQRSDAAQLDSVLTAAIETAPIPAKAAKTQSSPQPSPIVAAVEPVPIALEANNLEANNLEANKVQADTASPAAAATAVAAQDTSEPSTVPMMASVAAPVAAQEARAPLAAPTMSLEPATSVAPVARPKIAEQTVAPTATQMSAEAAPVPAADASVSLQTIANAYGEYTRKSLEQTKYFFDKLTGVRSLEQAVEIQTEFAKQACETFVAEAQKIHDLHRELARQRFERLEGLMTMGAQA
jgi:hypothetical protein